MMAPEASLYRIIGLFMLLSVVTTVQAEIRGDEVTYQAGDRTLKGYLAYDAAITGERPGILVVHEWWGHNDYTRKRARLLAAMGYTALAVDMYGDGKQADHPREAGQFSAEVAKNREVATARFTVGMNLLQQHATVNPDQISAIGCCFGGAVVLEMARQGLGLDLVASFHGTLGTSSPAAPGRVKARLLVFNGATDLFVKPEQIRVFKAEMDAAGADYRFISYPGAKHAFTNPDADRYGARFDLPLAYDLEADHRSWTALLAELEARYGR